MNHLFKTEFKVNPEGIAQLLQELQSQSFVKERDETIRYNLNLVIEECAAELIHHLAHNEEMATIIIWRIDTEFLIRIKFHGDGENWVENAPTVDYMSNISERKSHGLGLHLARNHCRYITLDADKEISVLQFAIELQS